MVDIQTSPIGGIALVTGGTSGIGLSFARALAGRGCDLILVARNAERLTATAQELHRDYGVAVDTITADLATEAGMEAVAERLEDDENPVQVLISNAGHGIHTPLTTAEIGEHTSAVELMVNSVLVLGGRAGRAMRRRASGVIVNVGSVAGLIPLGGYSAIKAWVNTYSEALALELKDTGVQVTTLVPGWVRTEFHDRAGIGTGSIPNALWLDSTRLVNDCLADVDKGKVESIPSKRFWLICFFLRRLPRPLVRAVAGKLMSKRGRG
ncbi:SDR family NAD(P)-dependent oxidoreductase [Pseudactinotalea sp. Z1739]|uniref:SDR family NAD(P)-dependent oxidoreductase n=1 Tax=Pseudactinotalea sp. Z1739 TaxID=3413028 RepID=UPI003C79B09C